MSPSVVTSVEWISANQVQYPNITVCHPKYFDIEKIKGLNLNPAVVAQGLKQQQQCLNTVATYCWWFESHLRHLKSYHFWEKILLGLWIVDVNREIKATWCHYIKNYPRWLRKISHHKRGPHKKISKSKTWRVSSDLKYNKIVLILLKFLHKFHIYLIIMK